MKKDQKALDAAVAAATKAFPRDFQRAAKRLQEAIEADTGPLAGAAIEPSYLEARAKRLIREHAPIIETRESGRGRDQSANANTIGRAHSVPAASTFRPASAPAAAIAMLTILDRHAINGRKLGDCTVAEVDGWRKSHDLRCRFYERLTQNLHPDMIVREHVSAEDADRLWEETSLAD